MSRDRPPLWSIVGTLLAAPLFIATFIVYVPWALTGWRLGPPFFGWIPGRWFGVALIVTASPIMLDFAARFVLEGHGTPVPVAPPQRLVVRGVYRFVRNPAYVAATLAMIGQALLFGSVQVLIYGVVMALAYHLLVVLHEEPSLRAKFGAEYEAYCRSVPRWWPRLRRRVRDR